METVTVNDVASCLEHFAPLSYQESYDNSGLLTGDPNRSVSGILVTLDFTEEVLEEAIAHKYNMIVAHHPIIFKGLKKLTGENQVERIVMKAIKEDIALYAAHTNIDNVHNGVSKTIAEKLGLENLSVLCAKPYTLTKLVSFSPKDHVERILTALHKAGAGKVGNYEQCSFSVTGTGAFLPTEDATPYMGMANRLERTQEVRFEVIFPSYLQKTILNTLHSHHPYEEVAYYLTQLQNENQEVGLGMVGKLKKPIAPKAFLTHIKQYLNTACIRHTPLSDAPVQKIALCGGAGSTLLPHAIAKGADMYISADFKYHDFFEADGEIIIADIGHYESEQFTKHLLKDTLEKKFSTFAIALSAIVTNPIRYF